MAKECDISRSKAERRKWWFGLSPQQQFDYIEKIVQAKSIKRRKRSIAIMKDHKGEYSCKDCIHGLTKSCTDNLKNGCEYWSGEGKKGLLELYPKLHKRQRTFNKIPLKTKNFSFEPFRTKERVNPNPKALNYRVPLCTH